MSGGWRFEGNIFLEGALWKKLDSVGWGLRYFRVMGVFRRCLIGWNWEHRNCVLVWCVLFLKFYFIILTQQCGDITF